MTTAIKNKANLLPIVTGAGVELVIGYKLSPLTRIWPPPEVGRPNEEVLVYELSTGGLYEKEDAITARPMMDKEMGRDTPLPRERGRDKQRKAALEMKPTASHDELPMLMAHELAEVPATKAMRECYSFG